MISVNDIKTIRELAEKYSLKKVLLFGSAEYQIWQCWYWVAVDVELVPSEVDGALRHYAM